MAQRVQVLLVCDLHEGDVAADESVLFGLDGTGYEIDLCAQHAGELRDTLARYVGVARKGRAAGAKSGRRGRRGGSSRATEIREWARSQSLPVSERGRISADLAAQYDAARR